MTSRTKCTAVTITIAALLAATPAWTAPGELAPTFGDDAWIVTTDLSTNIDSAYAVVRQPDGKILVAGFAGNPGRYGLARYASDGSLDQSFGTGGTVSTPVTIGSHGARAVALQPDGKIVAAGSNGGFRVVRYNSDGSLDSTFSGDGTVLTVLGSGLNEFARAVVVQSDGKIVAAGNVGNGGAGFGLVRYESNGVLDGSFGTAGIVLTDIFSSEKAHALAIQPDGKLVAAGESYIGGQWHFATVRYSTDGSLDLTFGTGGVVTTTIGSGARGEAVLLQSDGKLVVAGYFDNGSAEEFALVRYNSDGSPDTTFGVGGTVTTPIGSDAEARAIVQQGDGKLVVAGTSDYGFALVRYQPNGSLDLSFGNGGKVTTSVSGGSGLAWGIALESNGKIVVAGSNILDFALVRYLPDGTVDTGYTPGIVSTPDVYSLALVQQADGKILSAGGQYPPPLPAVTRYLSDGSVDTSFGVDGMATADFGAAAQWFLDVAELSDGKIAAAGWADNGDDDFIVARFSAGGVLDPTFGSGGMAVTDFGQEEDAVEILEQPGGALLVIGSSTNIPFSDFALARYTSTGALDPSFGSGGKVTTDFSLGFDAAESALLQSDGKIVVVGRTGPFPYSVAVARYDADGALDASFGSGGRVTVSILNDHDSADIVQLPDGKLVVSTTASDGSGDPYAGLLRLNTDGSLDTSFGSGGTAIGPGGYFVSLVRESGGKLVVAGSTDDAIEPVPTELFKFARFHPDGTLDASFGGGGVAYVLYEGQAYSDLVALDDGRLLFAGDEYASDGTIIMSLQSSFCHDPDPAGPCGSSAKSVLKWQQGPNPDKHKLTYKWIKGDQTEVADFADPTDTASYSLCIFDADGQVIQARVPPGGTCAGKPCWKGTPTGYQYKDKSRTHGIDKIKVKAGAAGKALTIAKGKGANLPDGDGQPLSGDVTAVLVNEDNGVCSASTFSGDDILDNDGVRLKAKQKAP